ncbi:MAG: 16S rRNA (adenine(1518)-N(6)/adenine(1519)-N(6))-dimethyltransferase RsmA [Chitinophagales bacterium]|nr:16S rRNA (adenine(1518)-N(6)/adenine(1519)-N(6))-dimethyltransferase RsmA [Chitinophagales bacterium]
MLKAKKIWGQHFLKDQEVIRAIYSQFPELDEQYYVLEVGPGPGVLTQELLAKYGERFYAVEVDPEMHAHLNRQFPQMKERLLLMDFLKLDLAKRFPGPLAIIGNFPYNISSQIVFKILENRDQVRMMLGMFQKEVAQRIVAPHGSKDYGILSVLAKPWYHMEYLFEVKQDAFDPPPKVMSAVIKLVRNDLQSLAVDERKFKETVKAAFNQRRKMLRNSLKGIVKDVSVLENPIFERRPEQMSLDDFIYIVSHFIRP